MTKHNLTVRVSNDQRTLLEQRAGNRPLADYIRQTLDIEETPKRSRAYKPQTDQVMLARILAALGSSDMAASMRDIADAARNGALPESPDTLLSLQAACLSIEKMRHDLISALGLKVED